MLNMFNSTANIYVSVGPALRRGSNESNGSHYRRPRHTYMISVEPHHFHLPGLPQHNTNLTHFEITQDTHTGYHGITAHSSRTAPGIVGNVLIAKSAQATVDKVRKALEQKLASAETVDDAYADDEDEHRLRGFLHALQDSGIIAKFDIDEFVMWIHGYAVDRSNGTAPTLIAYPRAHKEHQQKIIVHQSQTW